MPVQAHLSALPCVLQVDWKSEENRPVKPKLLGTQVYKEYDVKDILDYIDWNPFFQVGLVLSSVLGSSPPAMCNELRNWHLALCNPTIPVTTPMRQSSLSHRHRIDHPKH